MNFKESIGSLSTLGTIGLVFGLNLATPLQRVQAASNPDNRLSSSTLSSPTLIAQQSKNIRQRQTVQKRPQRQRVIRQNLRQTQSTVRSIVRQSPPRAVVNPTVVQERRKRQQEALNNLRERQRRDALQKQELRQRIVRQNLRQTQPTVKSVVRPVVTQNPPRPVVKPSVVEQRERQRKALENLQERQRREILQKREERQQNLREQVRENRLDIRRLDDRQRRLYRDYISYRNQDYFRDRYWVNRNYYSNRSYWSGPGYWYDREYWGRRGYIWNDVIAGVVGGVIQGTVRSAIAPSTLYPYAPQILNRNRLSVTACEPGTVVILLPNQRVMCAYPTATYLPGTYQVANSYALVPAVVNNPYSY